GNTSRPILNRLHAEINAALKAPDLKKKQQAAGIDPQGSATREEFAKFVREDTERWAKLVKEANIQVE
ncbi:MAG TPA: tripartite tricarboxylate transporter substrate-binding protein, partial [Burkholderiales bacterium]|nr:tripartite tricarboxylate transporter substrate-binding protein [Burkholderiales bacterium]